MGKNAAVVLWCVALCCVVAVVVVVVGLCVVGYWTHVSGVGGVGVAPVLCCAY